MSNKKRFSEVPYVVIMFLLCMSMFVFTVSCSVSSDVESRYEKRYEKRYTIKVGEHLKIKSPRRDLRLQYSGMIGNQSTFVLASVRGDKSHNVYFPADKKNVTVCQGRKC